MIKNLLEADEQPEPEPVPSASKSENAQVISLFDQEIPEADAEPFILSTAEPDSLLETARKSGLAWSIGVVLFSAVVSMLILGWGADLLFGTSPWGVVAGIVIGALIGFVQLFRISSQIFKKD
ncbi:MAG TPA: AtpZ/AtpI family protein [Pyrinomonadaceae bacterium]|nr:AtpZ/AtpI family protein [Pyrinomonadaceae bacterium]